MDADPNSNWWNHLCARSKDRLDSHRLRAICLFFMGLATFMSAAPASAQFSTAYFDTLYSRNYFGRLLPPAQEAFDFFDGQDTGTSIVNRYLLAHLSMKIYNNGASYQSFEEHLQVYYGNMGVQDVELFQDTATGADGALFVTEDAVIVVFRGTSAGENGSLADHFADIDNRVRLVKLPDWEVGIHEGFWDAASSVYPEVWTRVVTEVANGRKVWLTGHSLGGALASVTAFRLQYMDGIPVQGVQTFGAPRVGNNMFYKAVEVPTANAAALTISTQRFVLDGDPGPTFWNSGLDKHGRKHYYYHFGRTHTIFANGDGTYAFDYDSGELQMAWIPWYELFNRLSTGIHMDYELALFQETAVLLLASDQDDILAKLAELPQH